MPLRHRTLTLLLLKALLLTRKKTSPVVMAKWLQPNLLQLVLLGLAVDPSPLPPRIKMMTMRRRRRTWMLSLASSLPAVTLIKWPRCSKLRAILSQFTEE